jgi:DNA-directed RNA polymerase specialized sigma24 family protein
MPRALPGDPRRGIVRRHLHGQPLTQIASELRLPFDTVRAWNVLYPIHRAIFREMARKIARAAEATDGPARADRMASSP